MGGEVGGNQPLVAEGDSTKGKFFQMGGDEQIVGFWKGGTDVIGTVSRHIRSQRKFDVHNILQLFDILTNFSFAPNETAWLVKNMVYRSCLTSC